MNALKSFKSEWLILAFVALFLAITFAPIPGLFEIISIVLGALTLLLVVLLVAAVLRDR
jgi:hypothetical protein